LEIARAADEMPELRPYVPGMSTRKLTATAAAALAAAAIAAATGSAQSQVTSLHLVSTSQSRVGFFPAHKRIRQGDRFGFGQKVTGSDRGISRILCTAIGRQLMCTVQIRLAHGNLTAQGFVPQRANHTPFAITGGTGAYDGARGTALVTDVSSRKSDIDVSLLP
jgi:opacity protein-like surface antigen